MNKGGWLDPEFRYLGSATHADARAFWRRQQERKKKQREAAAETAKKVALLLPDRRQVKA